MIATHRSHRIQRQRHQLKSEIDDQQIAGRDHDHLPEQRKERQCIKLAAMHAPVCRIATGIDQSRSGRGAGNKLEDMPHGVGDIHAIHGVLRGLPELRADREHRQDQHDERSAANVETPDASLEDIGQQYRTGCNQQQNLGQCRTDIEVVHLT